MNAHILNSAMGFIDDEFLAIADAPKKEILQMSKKKNITRIFVIAAVVAMLAVTAYAADFLHIQSLVSSGDTVYSTYQQVGKAKKQAGLQGVIPENFANGYQFERVTVKNVDAYDENNHKAFTYKSLSVFYRNSNGQRLYLSINPELAALPESEHRDALCREIGGISVRYVHDHYKFVPEDYEPTEQDKLWMAQPGNYLSYGSDEVEESTMAFLGWSQDGARYDIMDVGGGVEPDTLFSMAEEIIAK